MSWEQRGSQQYYYRVRRGSNGQLIKTYYGTGPAAQRETQDEDNYTRALRQQAPFAKHPGSHLASPLTAFERRNYPRGHFYPKFIARKVVKQARQLGMMSYKVEDIEEFLRISPGIFSIDPRKRAEEETWVHANMHYFPLWLRELDKLPIRPTKGDGGKNIQSIHTVIDFDDMVRLPCIHNLAERFFAGRDTALVDESQDMNPYQLHLVTQLCKLGVRIVCCGDRLQCQPDGTQIAMTGGFYKPIENVQVGDGLVTYQSKNSIFAGLRVQGRKVLKKVSRPYQGFLYCFHVGSKRAFSTGNHKWLVRLNENAKGKYIVYLMKRGEQHRIGMSTLL
jgi:hypothetical protein